MSLGGESWAIDAGGDIPVPGQGGSAPGSQQVGEQWVGRGSSKHKPRLRRPWGVPRDVGAVVLRDCGMGQHWAMGWVKFCVGLEHFGHGRWDKQAPAVLLVLFSPETCSGICQS